MILKNNIYYCKHEILAPGGRGCAKNPARRFLVVALVVFKKRVSPESFKAEARRKERQGLTKFLFNFFLPLRRLCTVVVAVLAAATDAVLVAHQVHPATIAGNPKA